MCFVKIVSLSTLIRHKLFKLLGSCALIFCMIATEGVLAQVVKSEIEQGAEIAYVHCRRCHVIDEQNLYTGISSTPSFPFLVSYLEDWEERFQSFHVRLPHPSIVRFEGEDYDNASEDLYVPIILKYSDIDLLVAYAQSLKK